MRLAFAYGPQRVKARPSSQYLFDTLRLRSGQAPEDVPWYEPFPVSLCAVPEETGLTFCSLSGTAELV